MRRAALAALASLLAAAPAAGQEASVWVDANAAHTRPPSGAAVDPANYGLLGARLRLDGRSTSFDLGLHGGRGAAAESGSWAGASASGDWFGARGIVSYGVRGEASGIRYLEALRLDDADYRQSLLLASARPHLGLSLGGFLLRAEGVLTRGGWSTETTTSRLVSRPGPGLPIGGGSGGEDLTTETETDEGDIAVTGGALALTRVLGPATVEVKAERYDAENQVVVDGAYQGVGATVGFGAGPLDASVGVRRWSSPDGQGGSLGETGFHAAVGVPVGGRAYAQLGVSRSVADPVYGSEGSLGLSLGVSVRVGSTGSVGGAGPVVVGDAVDGKRRVRFRLRAGAERAAVAGDFTGWKPRPMRREGEEWVLELLVAPGVYHFSFVLDDGRWMVPADAPGIVDDGFGRKNATLVVES